MGECRFWLIKSEPTAFSWADQCANGMEPWSGVRNYQARNNLRAMKKGDLALFYHSVTEKRIVGVVEVVREAYPDPTFAPTVAGGENPWSSVDVRASGAFGAPVSLAQIKAAPELAEMALLKQSRLSVAPVRAGEFDFLTRLGAWTGLESAAL